ncbi:CMP-N-acetylneuraminate-beta-galactosamide-alpha-2,3-sialyltransferase 4 isoform X1 [Gorilla gorilla gorilla]|uniref:CMP-N-acetylneuraminate-beta-galactosamide- alpha-2,3-sialyltransferase 4 isoform X1 n=1 Tax=Gorilla gorilla gorilla TaxID=9595 RepID=UPI0024457E3D|nr:CMP-N-acetylneuraminate-beta-galactosamide-alpha-2,3-sialyltransferase 4 isoform X1 [Gorilla gorilla gorilla]
MVSKSRWKLLAMLALVLVIMVWYSISREDRYIELFYFPIPEKKEPCLQGEAESKASKLFGNYSRDQPIFLRLEDYFWVKTPSAYELPYGTKGSEDLLLRVLAITSSSIPKNIQSLRCRRCVVVGNGHRLRNSSLGDAINKYDVVIRLNNAPVAGYEGDVGSKTTMRLFYPESAHFDPKVENNPDTLLVLVAFKAMDFHWIETILSDKKRVRKGFWKQPPLIWDVNPKQIRILNPFFMEIAADKLLSLPMQQPRKIKQVAEFGQSRSCQSSAEWQLNPGRALPILRKACNCVFTMLFQDSQGRYNFPQQERGTSEVCTAWLATQGMPQQEGSCLQARKRVPTRTHHDGTLISAI